MFRKVSIKTQEVKGTCSWELVPKRTPPAPPALTFSVCIWIMYIGIINVKSRGKMLVFWHLFACSLFLWTHLMWYTGFPRLQKTPSFLHPWKSHGNFCTSCTFFFSLCSNIFNWQNIILWVQSLYKKKNCKETKVMEMYWSDVLESIYSCSRFIPSSTLWTL